MECFFPLMRRTQQPHEPQITLEKRGTNPADDTLHFVVGGLLNYFNGFERSKTNIENECKLNTINEDLYEDKYWPIEKIKQAWEKAQTMGRSDKKHWAYVIMLQVMKYLYHERPTQADSNFHESDESDDSENLEKEKGRTVETVAVLKKPETDYEKISFSQLSHNELKANPSEDELKKEDGPRERVGSKDSETVYIKIPLSQLFHNESNEDDDDEDADPINSNLNSKTYKLIDGCPSDPDIVRKKHTYVVACKDETKNAKWVYEILNKSTLVNNNPGKTIQFRNCKVKKGYERGHLAAASNHPWCQKAYRSTFVLSNFSPQLKTLNNGCWKSLEQYCRSKIKEDEKIRNVHVYTGPILEEDDAASEDEGEKKEKQQRKMIVKAVPDFFFKVIIVEKVDGTVEEPECYLIPNDEEKLKNSKKVQKQTNKRHQDSIKNKKTTKMSFKNKDFSKSIKEIERLSGLKFTDETFNGGEEEIRTVTWTGKDGNGHTRKAEIEVRINKPHTSR